MKKLFALIILSLAIVACEKEDSMRESKKNQESLYNMDSSIFLSEQKALEKVVSQMNLFNGCVGTKSKHYGVRSVEIINPPTKSDVNSPLFLFNFDNAEGFALISADKRDENTIYLLSTEGNLDGKLLTDKSSPYNFLYECVNQYQRSVISQYREPLLTKGAEDEELVITRSVAYQRGPYLTTRWEQGNPFNQILRERLQIPSTSGDCNVGCTPLAIGQIFNCVARRKGLITIVRESEMFNMNYVRQIKNLADAEDDLNYVDSNGNSGLRIREVSKLLYHIGQAVGTTYSYDSTITAYVGSTPPGNNVLSGIRSFGLTCSGFREYSINAVKNALDSCAVLANGWPGDGSMGHTWVIDGYKEILDEYRTYDGNGNLIENTVAIDYNRDITTTYFHCNFGWDKGEANGDYKISQIFEVEGWPTRTYFYSDIFRDTNRSMADNTVDMRSFAYPTVEVITDIGYPLKTKYE